jgi:ankyrin repeat protein
MQMVSNKDFLLCKHKERERGAQTRTQGHMFCSHIFLSHFAGATPVHYASATGNQGILLYLLQECRAEIIVYDINFETPLHYAARRGKMEITSMLIEQFHVDPNIYVPRKVGTPLDAAKTSGQKKVVEYLKSRGGINAKKLDKKREEELAKEKPAHLEATLLRNGLLADSF